jgi:hypothetical protein
MDTTNLKFGQQNINALVIAVVYHGVPFPAVISTTLSQPQKKKIKMENMNCRLLSLKADQNIPCRFTKSDCRLNPR